MAPYLVAVTIVTAIACLAPAVFAQGTESLRGARTAHPLQLAPLACAATLAPAVLFLSLANATRTVGHWLAAGVAGIWTLARIPDAAQVWSPAQGMASIACFGSAAALAFAHCRKHA